MRSARGQRSAVDTQGGARPEDVPPNNATFGDLATRYRKEAWPVKPHVQQSYNSNMKYLETKWGDSTLAAMVSDPAKVEIWLNSLTSNKFPNVPLSRRTRMHIRMLLHHNIECAMRWGLLGYQMNPASSVRILKGARPKPRELLLTPTDFNKLVTAPGLPDHVKVMSTVAMMTGGAISRVLGMRWDDPVDFECRMIHFRRSIVGKHIDAISEYSTENDVAMPDLLAQVLKNWKASQKVVNGWLFGSMITGRPFHAMTLQGDYLKPVGEQLGLPGLGWYTFRYSFGKYLNKLETVEAVQELFVSELNRQRGSVRAA